MSPGRFVSMLRCPACGEELTFRPRVQSFACTGKVLHTYRVRGGIVDLVHGPGSSRQKRVNRTFERISGRTYEKNVTGASGFDRFLNRVMWGTTKFIPLFFEMLDSVTEDCDPGFFLDIPIGTGVFTAGEYSRVANLDFVAVDYSLGMLESANEKIMAEDFGNVILVRADAANLPFRDGVFSGVLTMNGISAFPDKPASLDELVRVLKPGGKLAGSDYVSGERWLTDVLMGNVTAWMGGFTPPIFTEEELCGALEIRGVNNIVTRKVGTILFFSGRKTEKTGPWTPG